MLALRNGSQISIFKAGAMRMDAVVQQEEDGAG